LWEKKETLFRFLGGRRRNLKRRSEALFKEANIGESLQCRNAYVAYPYAFLLQY